MGITGLSLLFGRAVLIPVFGLPAFAAYAAFAKLCHNYLGPFFMAGVLVEVVVWMRYNLFTRDDCTGSRAWRLVRRQASPCGARQRRGEGLVLVHRHRRALGVCVSG